MVSEVLRAKVDKSRKGGRGWGRMKDGPKYLQKRMEGFQIFKQYKGVLWNLNISLGRICIKTSSNAWHILFLPSFFYPV